MQLGMIGLGRMGGNMTKRLTAAGHDLRTFDPGVAGTASSLAELRDQLDAPRAFWTMVPAGKITEDTFQQLISLGEPGDAIVDGGNSNFRDSQRRHAEAKTHGIHFVDAGVSGGVWGLENGYCLMVGGTPRRSRVSSRSSRRLAPEGRLRARGRVRRRPLREDGPQRDRVRPDAGLRRGLRADATRPSSTSTCTRSRDLALRLGRALVAARPAARRASRQRARPRDDPGYVEDSGEGRWTLEEAIAEDVPVPVITASLFARFARARTSRSRRMVTRRCATSSAATP